MFLKFKNSALDLRAERTHLYAGQTPTFGDNVRKSAT